MKFWNFKLLEFSYQMEQCTEESNNIIFSPSLLKWNPSKYVFNPDFDLGLGDEWTVRFLLKLRHYQFVSIEFGFANKSHTILGFNNSITND